MALNSLRIRPAHWLLAFLAVLVLILAAGVTIWWGSIREALMDPGVPYQTYTPPPPPNYEAAKAWALLPPDPQGPAAASADVFFIHPTTFSGRQWNAPIGAKKADALLTRTMIPNYAGPFNRVGRVFAPKYRQASLYTLMTLREDAQAARAFAYQDIAAAFTYYLAHYNQGRPVVLVGVEQGGLLADRLAREVIGADPALTSRLVVVYLIETPVAAETYLAGGPISPCLKPGQTGCVAAWIGQGYDEKHRIKERLHHAPMWQDAEFAHLNDRRTLCFNPLLGASSEAAAPARDNIGAANASGLEWGVRPGFQKHEVGVRCIAGVLHIDRPRSPALRRGHSWIESQRVRPHNVFYADIEADALARVAAMSKSVPPTK